MKKWFFLLTPFIIFGFVVFYYVGSKKDLTPLRYSNQKTFKSQEKSLEEENNIIDDFDTIENKEENLQNNLRRVFALEIKGSEDFKLRVKDSLRILWSYDKEGSFRMIRRYVFEIRESNRTMFIYDNEIPVIELSESMFQNSSKTYLASVIAHMGWHSYYLYMKKNKNKKDVPLPGNEKIDKNFVLPFSTNFKRLDDLYKVEEEAFKYQISVLKKINAPVREIRMLEERSYRDLSPAHDGNYFIQF